MEPISALTTNQENQVIEHERITGPSIIRKEYGKFNVQIVEDMYTIIFNGAEFATLAMLSFVIVIFAGLGGFFKAFFTVGAKFHFDVIYPIMLMTMETYKWLMDYIMGPFYQLFGRITIKKESTGKSSSGGAVEDKVWSPQVSFYFKKITLLNHDFGKKGITHQGIVMITWIFQHFCRFQQGFLSQKC